MYETYIRISPRKINDNISGIIIYIYYNSCLCSKFSEFICTLARNGPPRTKFSCRVCRDDASASSCKRTIAKGATRKRRRKKKKKRKKKEKTTGERKCAKGDRTFEKSYGHVLALQDRTCKWESAVCRDAT